MHDSDDRPLELIKWGNRLLYVLLFISCMVVMGYWHVPITYTFLGAVFCLILPLLFSKEEESDNVKCSWCGDMVPGNSVHIIPDAYLDKNNEWHQGEICSPCNNDMNP